VNKPDLRNTDSRRLFSKLRLYFFTGLVALAPVVITAYILWYLFFTVDNWLNGFYDSVPFLTIGGQPIPGLGFLTIVLLIILAGVIARNIIGSQILKATESQFTRLPLVRGIYNGAKQLTQAIFGGKRALFQQVVLVPFPTRGVYAIAFYTADAAPEILRKTQDDMVSVFLPTTPNPTSGYMLIVRRSDIIPLDMNVEEAVKLVISGGAVIPEDRAMQMIADAASGETANPEPSTQPTPESTTGGTEEPLSTH